MPESAFIVPTPAIAPAPLAAPPPDVLPADRAAFGLLFRAHYAALAGYAARIVGASRADDVVQDVFAKLWRDRRRIVVEASTQALLYRMVRNRALNHIRDRRRVAQDADAEAALDARAAGADAGDALDDARRLALVRRWIGELPERRREAFVLSRDHGLTHAEIADVMGLSRRTVDTHILLALRTLRERLAAVEQGDSSP